MAGAHSIGFTHCFHFQDRLYNFQDSRKPDPTMDTLLGLRCPQNSPGNRPVNLDQNPPSSFTLDNSFYKQIILGRILQIDQELALHTSTNDTVASLATGNDFPVKFGQNG